MLQALRQSEEKYRSLVELSTDAVFVVEDGVIRYANGVARRALGFARQDITGRDLFEFLAPEERVRVQEIRDRRRAGDAVPTRFESAVVGRDGQRIPIEVSVAPIVYEGRPAMLVVSRDVTERRRMQAEVLRARKLESLADLAGGIAHDFNNVLTTILAHLALARLDAGDPGAADAVGARIEAAEAACLRARDLTRQLLRYSARGVSGPSAAPTADVVRDAAEAALRGASVRAELKLSDRLWTARIDAGRLHEALHSLVARARQVTPEGGAFRIEAGNVPAAEAARLDLPAERHVRITVIDRGEGIPPENLDRVFDPYFAVRRDGTGLGLAVAYGIVTRHGGRIEVDSQAGTGSSFRIYLPAARRRTRAATTTTTTAAPRPARRARVLLMDDDVHVLDVAAAIVRRLGHDVRTAVDGREAVRLYREARSAGRPFAAAILDLTVPGGMGARECVRRLRALDPAVRAIVSSGYANDPVLAAHRRHGFRGVVAKPYRLKDLQSVLDDVLA